MTNLNLPPSKAINKLGTQRAKQYSWSICLIYPFAEVIRCMNWPLMSVSKSPPNNPTNSKLWLICRWKAVISEIMQSKEAPKNQSNLWSIIRFLWSDSKAPDPILCLRSIWRVGWKKGFSSGHAFSKFAQSKYGTQNYNFMFHRLSCIESVTCHKSGVFLTTQLKLEAIVNPVK